MAMESFVLREPFIVAIGPDEFDVGTRPTGVLVEWCLFVGVMRISEHSIRETTGRSVEPMMEAVDRENHQHGNGVGAIGRNYCKSKTTVR